MLSISRAYLLGTAAAVLIFPAMAQAQAVSATPVSPTAADPVSQDTSDGAPGSKDIVVTGSRISQKGYSSPTPVTVVDADTLEKSAASDIPDALNKLPQLANSRSNNQSLVITPQRALGGNYLNLRGIGIGRVLTLFDGQRLAPTEASNAVDSNILPQLLISRVDIVTAGASAGYGSDAVTGVVNYVLDKNFKGVKGVIDAGISNRGDDGQKRVGLAAGTSLLDDKLHLEGSFEYFHSDGIDAAGKLERFTAPFPMAVGTVGAVGAAGSATNPYVTIYNARNTLQSFGGLIKSGPLTGQQFLPGGTLAPFNYGTATGTAGVSSGGDGAYHDQMYLTPEITNKQAFARASYEITPSITGYVYGNYATSDTFMIGATQSVDNTTIYAGNAFLTAAESAALGSTASFLLGRRLDEAGGNKIDGHTRNFTTGAGLEGHFGSGWKWNVNYTHSYSRLTITQENQIQLQRYAAAVDAVRDPSGNIVCRVTLTNPGLYPGCVPLNLFGAGSPSAAALAYVLQPATFSTINTLDDGTASLSGSPFSLWAGPLSFAVGVEYRKATLLQTSNADPALPVDFTGLRSPVANRLFNTGQNGVAAGANNVKEAFLEVAVPLLKDLPFARAFDVNGAVRYTDYSTSGSVETWKGGFNYVPVSGIRFRGTISRDIRAPTLFELYSGTQFNRTTITDSLTKTTGDVVFISGGNPNLKPEISNTKTIGIVLQPSFLRGFSASVDGFEIHIKDGISSVAGATVLQQCNAGITQFCAQVIRPISATDTSAANFPTQVNVLSINLAHEVIKGIDFEASQHVLLGAESSIDFHLAATYVPTRTVQTLAGTAPINLAGAIQYVAADYSSYPKWTGSFQVDYANGPFDLFLEERYVGAMDRNYIPSQQFADHYYKPVYYTNGTVSVKLGALGGRGAMSNATLFFNVNNLFNRKPPLVADVSSPGLIIPTNQSVYDVIGRYMTAGVRFRF